MVYTGQIRNGAVVFDNGSPPEGAKVRVEVLDAPAPIVQTTGPKTGGVWAVLRKYAGSVKGLPPDFARNHDHYIHGAPKKP